MRPYLFLSRPPPPLRGCCIARLGSLHFGYVYPHSLQFSGPPLIVIICFVPFIVRRLGQLAGAEGAAGGVAGRGGRRRRRV